VFVGLFKTMRPRQWIKNVFVFAPLVFDKKLLEWEFLARTIAGFLLLCLVSGTVYIINDLADAEKDREHPKKRMRPIASGKVGTGTAIAAAILILLITLPLSFVLSPLFGAILSLYLVMQVAYSLSLKNIVIIDVMVIASGFLLRVAAGVPLVEAERFSPWLYVCMLLGALLVGFGKRRHELVLLKENANSHRQSLEDYSLQLLDHAITIVTASTLLAYALYTFSAEGLPPDDTMMLTIPFVLYAVFRYLYLIHVKGIGGEPEDIILSDRPFQIAILLWGTSVIVILYLVPWLQTLT
jgi:4-hydroxybenzoate polyprenyltransferase